MAEDGFKRVQARFLALRTAELQKAQRKALTGVGKLVQGAIQARTPVKAGTEGGSLEPGELRDNIKYRTRVPSDEAVVQGAQARVVIGPSGRERKLVAHDVEYGHANIRNGRQSEVSPDAPAYPFIRLAAEEIEPDAVDLYRYTMLDELAKAAK